jgi:hypothetical protein
MHLVETNIRHDRDGWKVDFIGADGDAVTVKVAGGAELNCEEALERARAVMVQLTAFGTRGGGQSLNRYDAISNGNFDDNQPLLITWH